MSDKHSGKLKIVIALGILFVVVSILMLLVFYAGKKTYVVRFDLNGGTLISGSVEQHVTQGQDATPPVVVKDGAYFHSWRGSYRQVTKDTVIEAVWEYDTTKGIIYADCENQNFTEIIGSYEYLRGEVYLGAYFNEKKILGIDDWAFADRRGITKVYLIEGLVSIGEGAFENCTGLTEIEIPETVTRIGKGAFKDCTALERLVLNEGLLEIEEGAFEGCINLKEIILPRSVAKIGLGAFARCDHLTITVQKPYDEDKMSFSIWWHGGANVVWPPVETDTSETESGGEAETKTESDG